MKKNILIKGILLLVVVALLAIGFSGCYPAPPICMTATVNITTPLDSWTYWIYIDDVFWGTTNTIGNMTLYNVPTGYHKFYALSNDWLYEGTVYATILCGTNYVAINTY